MAFNLSRKIKKADFEHVDFDSVENLRSRVGVEKSEEELLADVAMEKIIPILEELEAVIDSSQTDVEIQSKAYNYIKRIKELFTGPVIETSKNPYL